ncbi:MAG: SufE protein involved in Fe-S center assembly [Firmicutes bacterium]|nr:SufE protein involved in Fe-S center assembly [Bacillota bacterium]
MQGVEEDILQDLKELADLISQYTYLIECAGEAVTYPPEYLTDEYLVPECQAKTWIYVKKEQGRVFLFAESESLLVKGALALLQEIYYGRSEAEVRHYTCGLLRYEGFYKHFTQEQLRGLKYIFKQIGHGY